MVLGQSSLPIWVPGTIEFIWAGGIPLNPHHKIIPPQNHLFPAPRFGTKNGSKEVVLWRNDFVVGF